AAEGIFFLGSTCSTHWLRKRGLMPGLTNAVELISRDEKLHSDFSILLCSKLENKLSKEKIAEIISEAVTLERNFVREAIPAKIIGLDPATICQHIEFHADKLLLSFGCEKIYNSTDPFFIKENNLSQSNKKISELRAAEYRKAGVRSEATEEIFSSDEEF
ncbi:MAG TPA: ribonucleotide-diphosphate reductase subunit beta, partial [Bacteroidia bacterium]